MLVIFDSRIATATNRVTGSPYHHAMIVAGEATVLHSGSAGVHSANPLRMVFEKPDDVYCPSILFFTTFSKFTIATQCS